MNNQVEFSVHCVSGVDDYYDVVEDGSPHRHVASFQGLHSDGTRGEQRAKARAAFSNAEHAHGRVAQAVCKGGHACDFDRIHVPLRDLKSNPHAGKMIYCAEHAATVAAA